MKLSRVELFLVWARIELDHVGGARRKSETRNAGDFSHEPQDDERSFSPKASQAIDQGVALQDAAAEVDIDGDKRDARPDIGADER